MLEDDRQTETDRQTDGQTQIIILPSNMLEDDRQTETDRQTDGQTQRIILPSNMLEDDRQTGRHKESFFLLICWKMTDRQADTKNHSSF